MDPDELPVKKDRQQPDAIQVRPAETALAPRAASNQAKQFHGLSKGRLPDGITHKLARALDMGEAPPWIECQILSRGTDALEYCFSIEDVDDSGLDVLETSLRTLFPDEYELRRTYRENLGVTHLTQDAGDDWYVAGVEYVGEADRRQDWQTRLEPFATSERTHQQTQDYNSHHTGQNDHEHSPLTTIIETMATSSLPMVYQVLFRPLDNWHRAADDRIEAIETGTDTLWGQLAKFREVDLDRVDLSQSDRQRRAEIQTRASAHSFAVNARAAVLAPADEPHRADHIATQLQSAFSHISGEFHSVTGRVRTDDEGHLVPAGRELLGAIHKRAFYEPTYQRPGTAVPLTANDSRGIVVDHQELPHFFAIDGNQLTPDARRALETIPEDQTSITLPPESVLDRYRQPGLAIGAPRTNDGTTTDPIAIPPTVQTRNVAWIGQTGAGKTTSLITAGLSNHRATSGAEIILDSKGGRMPREYMQSHVAEFGDLDDVIYFDCAEWLPAISFFDIKPELDAGVPRAVAVEDRVAHYQQILRQNIGTEQYDRAFRSIQAIGTVLEALYDPIHGRDVVTNRDIQEALKRFADRETPPAVSNPDLEERLDSLVSSTDTETFKQIIGGAINRIETVSSSTHLSRIFNHRPSGIEADQPAFDFADWLDEDVVIILDTGRLRPAVREELTLAVLSNLWTALRRRRRRRPNADLPLVNVYLEEAASVANSTLLTRLLAQSRSFGCALLLAMQFPGQLEATDADVYAELLNNVGSYITSTVGVDHDLAHRFATEAMDNTEMANRLRGLSAGEWLVDLPGEFQGRDPNPFMIESLPLPAGHPDRVDSAPAGFESAHDAMRDRTRGEYGLSVAEQQTTEAASATVGDSADAATAQDVTAPVPAGIGAESDPDGPSPSDTADPSPILTTTSRMPSFLRYTADSDALECTTCNSRFDSTADGLRTAIQCCHDLDSVDLDDVPICSCNVTLSPEEIQASKWSRRQLTFLQAVHNAQQRRYDRIEYDIVHDSMIRLKEDVGIDQDKIDDLLDAGLLRHDGDHPQRYYTVTPEGRDAIGEEFQAGVDFGHGKGDLDESSQHVAMIEASARWLRQERVADPDCPDAEVVTYYEVREGSADAAAFMGGDDDTTVENLEQRRLDCVTLDETGDVVVAVEAERINNDVTRAVPEDYDKMAACDPEEAIWVVLSQADGHDILEALNDPPEGEPRVEKTYSSTTPPQQFRIDQPGLTAIYPMTWLQRQVQDESR